VAGFSAALFGETLLVVVKQRYRRHCIPRAPS
jgi:hypothetical protein